PQLWLCERRVWGQHPPLAHRGCNVRDELPKERPSTTAIPLQCPDGRVTSSSACHSHRWRRNPTQLGPKEAPLPWGLFFSQAEWHRLNGVVRKLGCHQRCSVSRCVVGAQTAGWPRPGETVTPQLTLTRTRLSRGCEVAAL